MTQRITHLPRLDPDRWHVMHGRRGDGAPKEEWLAELSGQRCAARVTFLGWSPHNFGWGFQLGRNGDESDIGLDLHAGRFAHTWLRLRAPWLKRLRQTQEQDPEHWYKARHTGLTIHPSDGVYVRWSFEELAHEWHSADPWWRRGSIGHDQLFGRTDCAVETVDEAHPRLQLPEGHYEATATCERRTWTHRRWPGTWLDRVRPRPEVLAWEIEVAGGIPVEGKGESSWDCGMDATFSSYVPVPTLSEACERMVTGILERRQRNGGPHNLPHPMTMAEAEAWQAAR